MHLPLKWTGSKQYVQKLREFLSNCVLTIPNKCVIFQVERWLRLRRLQQLPNTLQKFQETGWRWDAEDHDDHAEEDHDDHTEDHDDHTEEIMIERCNVGGKDSVFLFLRVQSKIQNCKQLFTGDCLWPLHIEGDPLKVWELPLEEPPVNKHT